jgi:hypothetical protein
MSPINVYTHPPQRTKPIQSLQCFHCQDTIETLNDKVMHLMSQRTWVGLTDERREQLIQKCWREYIAGKEDGTTFGEWMSVATEAELKQKNGYAEEKNNG